ncbi:MAG: nucleotidyltransferase [Epsilonproteobacteria bacterium]|nr:MAG: nucleotidyltransferase [Campylobacterota bacterium]
MNRVKLQIEELLYENAEDFKIAKVLKEDIKIYFNTLENTFSNSSGKDFLVQHTKKIDSILKLIYKVAHRNMFGDYMPMKNNLPVALVALGSYGREQLCVHSDIDIMFVYKDIAGYNIKVMIEKMLYILWDTGLKLGHRVHTVEELFDVSKTDITIKTALIESRFIEGSNFIWTQTQNAINKIRLDKPSSFMEEKLLEQKRKHEKYPLTMEPNLKEGVGGFRDANLIYWIGKVLYNSNNIKNLPLDIVTDKEYREFRIALEFLFRVRSALHLATGKKEDTLRLELIPEVANLLGFEQTKEAHRKFTKKVTGSLKSIRLYSIIWLNILTKEYVKQREEKHIVFPTSKLDEDLNKLVEYLCSHAHAPFEAHPKFLQQLIHANKPNRLNKSYYKSIKKIFYQEHAYSILNTLSYARLLWYIIPPMKKVVDLPQFDGYHQYAVDIHSLKSLKHLENIEEPFIKELFDVLNSEEKAMMKVVTFLHDAGKGRSRDHHQVGATIFKLFANNIHMDEKLIEHGITLILYHTLMSSIAQREDLHSEKVILKFASHFKNKKLLDLIYILTYADMNGVGSNTYNTFNAKLLKTLYIQSVDSLEHEKELNETARRVKKENALKKNVLFLELKKSEQKKIFSIPSNLLFLRYSADEIITISKRAFLLKEYDFIISNKTHLTIEIIRDKNLNLGYLLAKLSYLKVINMDIAKLFNNYKYFKIDFTDKVSSDDIIIIEQIIHDSFQIEDRGILKTPAIKEKELKIDCNHSKTYGALYLNSDDQNGLLAFIIDIFDELKIDIASAKIHTTKNRTRDIFLIEKDGNFCHNIDIIIDKLTKRDK